jgi:hypothetical protein
MPMTQEWYNDYSNKRGVLIKIGVYSTGVEEPLGETYKYVSNVGYTTRSGDRTFNPIVTGNLRFSENLTPEGGISISYGDIELLNLDGSLDSWLEASNYIWVNRPIEIYFCDPTVVVNTEAEIYTTFDLVFSGVIFDIDSKNKNTLNIKVRDKMERLNTPITENTLGTYGTWGTGQTNQDNVLPLIFGEPHNFQPLLIDPSQIEYIVGDGQIEQITEIRDNGVPIYTVGLLTGGATVNLTTGKFKLTRPIAGECTVSAQGIKKSINLTTGALENTYVNNIANIIALIVTQYGNTASRLSSTDIDLANFLAFSSANTQYVGVYINSRENLLTVCQNIASSIGAQIYFTRVGKLQLLQYGTPNPADSLVHITPADMILNSLSISNRSAVVAAKKIGYCKNWYLQENLVTAIPAEHKYMFGTEYWIKTSADTTGSKDLYKLNVEPVQKDTYLIDGVQANTEATRLNNFFGQVRTTYRFSGTSKLLTLKLGQAVSLTHPRFGLAAGKNGQVVSLAPDWASGKIEIEVVV